MSDVAVALWLVVFLLVGVASTLMFLAPG